MAKFDFDYSINLETGERMDDINKDYDLINTLSYMLEQMADDYAESCLLLIEEKRIYDLDKICVRMTFSNIKTDETEEHIVYAKEIEE